jgi:hypothetical protein
MLRICLLCAVLVVCPGVRSWGDIPRSLHPIAKQVQALIKEHEPKTRDIDSLELFAGKAEYSNACARLHLRAVAYDKDYSDSKGTSDNDLTTEDGFIRAFNLVLRIVEHGALWAAPVCSTWGFVGRKGTFRSKDSARGDEENPRTRNANMMVYNLCLLLIAAYLRGVHLLVEQPHGSLMAHFWPFSAVIKLMTHQVTTYLHAFGHLTMKTLTIWSTNKAVQDLKRPKPKQYETLCRKHDKGTTGKPDKLKQSQAYPKAFGEAVAQITVAALREADVHDLYECDVAASLVNLILDRGKGKPVRKSVLKKPVSKRPAARTKSSR